MNKNNVIYKVIVFISIILLVVLFILINIIKTNNKEQKPTTTTTTTVKIDDKVFTDKIYFDGEEQEIKIKTYTSYLGFKINYDIENFSATKQSDGSIVIKNVYDENIGIIVEKITEETYELEKSREEEIIDNYIYTYYYYNNGDNYLKLTKVYKDDIEFLTNIEIRLNYMVNTLYFT